MESNKHRHIRELTRLRKKNRIKKKLTFIGRKLPRLVVFRSNMYLYAQIINDLESKTLLSATTREEAFKNLKSKKNKEAAEKLGALVGARALEQKIEKIVFDRNGYSYHGRIKAIADGAREAGLKF